MGRVTDPRPNWYPSLQLQHGTNWSGVLHLLARQLLAKKRLHHFSTTRRQDRQQAVTQTVGLLVTALKPDTSPCTDLSRVHLDPVVPAGDPLLQVCGPQVLNIAQNFLVRIALVASRHHEGVNFQSLLAFRGSGGVLGGPDMEAHPVLRAVVLNASDLAGGKDPVLPLGLVGVLDTLEVQVIVNLLDQFETDNAIVGCLVSGEGALTLFGRLVVEGFDTFRVEDFVDTVDESYC